MVQSGFGGLGVGRTTVLARGVACYGGRRFWLGVGWQRGFNDF